MDSENQVYGEKLVGYKLFKEENPTFDDEKYYLLIKIAY
jgi:hypothetical protein